MSEETTKPKKTVYVVDGQKYQTAELIAALRLAPLIRKRIKAIEGGVGGRNWRAQEDACEILRNVLKEAGLDQ